MASDMVNGFGDAHHDRPGDRTNCTCIGLHDVNEVSLFGRSLVEGLNEPYGLDIAVIGGADSVEVASHKQDLWLFKYPNG